MVKIEYNLEIVFRKGYKKNGQKLISSKNWWKTFAHYCAAIEHTILPVERVKNHF